MSPTFPALSDEERLCFASAEVLAAAYRERSISPVEVVQAILQRAERLQPRLNAFVTRCDELALAQARQAEAAFLQRQEGLPPLFGIPVTVKDLEDTAGVRTTYGSKHFADHVPDSDAPIWARLKAQGAILIGKTATPEFGSHSVTESLLTGTTNNPWDLSRTTGGSSGGAGAAVAAGLAPLATGSDGGGSIRVPSSFCGVVGLKATPGRIPFNSRRAAYEGVTVVGPITRTVADCALMMDAISGPDPYDAISLLDQAGGYYESMGDRSIRGLRVAYCADLRNGPMERRVRDVVGAAARRFEQDLRTHVHEIQLSLPDAIDYFTRWWTPPSQCFYEDVLVPLGHPEWVSPGIRWGLEQSRDMDLMSYVRLQTTTRTQLHNAFADVFEQHDLLIWPTTPFVAFEHPGPELGPKEIDGIPTRCPIAENQRFTEPVSHAGYPAITVPAGFTPEGLPVGLQIAARHGAEKLLLKAAAAFEAAAPWASHRPPC